MPQPIFSLVVTYQKEEYSENIYNTNNLLIVTNVDNQIKLKTK